PARAEHPGPACRNNGAPHWPGYGPEFCGASWSILFPSCREIGRNRDKPPGTPPGLGPTHQASPGVDVAASAGPQESDSCAILPTVSPEPNHRRPGLDQSAVPDQSAQGCSQCLYPLKP